MNSSDLTDYYGRKVWKPEFNRPQSTIFVLTNRRRKKQIFKREYQLKINNVQMSGKRNNFLADNHVNECNNNLFENSKTSQKFYGHPTKINFQFSKNMNEIQNHIQIKRINNVYKNEFKFEEKQLKTIKIVKTEKKLARKVYLSWSKYSMSNNDADFSCAFNSNSVKITSKNIRRKYLIKKYWNLWRYFVKNKKLSSSKNEDSIENKSVETGENSINEIKNSTVFKRRNTANRIIIDNSEKHIIEIQKQKIEEQSNLIKELQLIRLKLEEEKFAQQTRDILEESKHKYDKKLQSKAKYLSSCNFVNKVKVNKYEDAWNFVTRMEVRANERKKCWNAIKERKQRLENERCEKLKLEEEKRFKLEEEKKIQKVLKIKEEKRRTAELKRKQEEERAYMSTLHSLANEHYTKLLFRISLNAFTKNVYQVKLQLKEAEQHYNQKILLRFFTIWRLFWKIEMRIKFDKAREFYEFTLQKKSFVCFVLVSI